MEAVPFKAHTINGIPNSSSYARSSANGWMTAAKENDI